jgi:hypothetical protein
MNTFRNTALALALVGAAATGIAAVRNYSVRPSNWSSGAVAGVLVPLNAAGATTINVVLPAAGRTWSCPPPAGRY